ncbi:MAG: energy transducer TonB [Desulfobacterales bacterium]
MRSAPSSTAAPAGSSPLPAAPDLREAQPEYRKNPPLEYPQRARTRGYQGTVVLEVLVDRHGKVSDIRVLSSSGHAILDSSAMNSVRNWSFEPGRKGQERVEMWVRVPVRFRLE